MHRSVIMLYESVKLYLHIIHSAVCGYHVVRLLSTGKMDSVRHLLPLSLA
jgi:hypothetical protein